MHTHGCMCMCLGCCGVLCIIGSLWHAQLWGLCASAGVRMCLRILSGEPGNTLPEQRFSLPVGAPQAGRKPRHEAERGAPAALPAAVLDG